MSDKLPPPREPEGVHVIMHDGTRHDAVGYRYDGVRAGRHVYMALFDVPPFNVEQVSRFQVGVLPGRTEVSIDFVQRAPEVETS